MKPGEVVVIRLEPMRAHVEDMLPAEMASASPNISRMVLQGV
jgi:hypothetical protein